MQDASTQGSSSPLRLLREALAGTAQDFTEGSLTRGIAMLAIPTALEMLMESTFGLADALFVARLGPDAMAAVGLTEALVVLLFSIGAGLAMGATATVARRIGEKDREGAAVAAAQAIALGIAFSLVTGVLGARYHRELLGLMDATPSVIAAGAGYTRIILGANGAIIMLFLINGIFRGAGDAAMAMRTLALANAVNLALDPCLIYGIGPFPRLGVTGAAVATTTGRSLAVLYQFWMLVSGRGRVVLARRHLRLDLTALARLARLSGTTILQYFISTASWSGLARINASFGSSAVAGYTLALRIIMFALMPSWGICSAAATLVGQNLGANRPERSERAVWLAGVYNMAFLAAIGAVFVACADTLVGLFTTDPAVAPVAAACLRYVSFGYPFYAWGMVMEQAFNGAGDSSTPTWINLFCYWLFQIPFTLWLAFGAGAGPRGVYLGICTAETMLAVVAVAMFRRGAWKAARV